MGSGRLRTLKTIEITTPPQADIDRIILPLSIPKHGWRWVKADETGDFWGTAGGGLLQVRNEQPNYPARAWSKASGD